MTSPDSPRVGVSPDAKSELQTGNVPTLDGHGLRVAVLVARFNDVLTGALADACRKTLDGLGVAEIRQAWVPGAFELPLAAKQFAASALFDAVVAIGAVVRGDTPHFDYVAGECAAGLMRAQLETGTPIVFGVLTTDTVEQARERLDKGAEFAVAAVEMATLLRSI